MEYIVYWIKYILITATVFAGPVIIIVNRKNGILPVWAMIAIYITAIIVEFLFFLQYNHLDNMDDEEEKQIEKEEEK